MKLYIHALISVLVWLIIVSKSGYWWRIHASVNVSTARGVYTDFHRMMSLAMVNLITMASTITGIQFTDTNWHTTWWRHKMEIFSALLAICAGNSPVPGEFPTQRPVTQSFDVFFDLRLNKRLSKQPWGWWFETLSCPLWRHCNAFRTSVQSLTHWSRIIDIDNSWNHRRGAYSSTYHDCMLLNTPNSHRTVKHRRRCWLKRVIKLISPMLFHDDVIKWKHFPRYWPFVRGIHRSRWIPHTKASDAELWCFLWSAPV